MNDPDRQTKAFARDLKAVRTAAAELTTQLRSASNAGRDLARLSASACVGGACSGDGGSGKAGGVTGSGLTGIGNTAATALTRSLTSALSGAASSLQSAMRSMLTSLARTLASTVSRAMGGGVFGGLLGGVVGGGLTSLLGGLFKRRQRVTVDNTVRAEVLNFPRLNSLGLAVNPASRLLGGRALARGPAFTVEVNYRGGAEDVVAAKVASHLRDLNLQQGAF